MPRGGNLVRNERYRKAPRTPRSNHARYYYTRSLVLDTAKKRTQNKIVIRCQSAPKVMDSHSRSASPREPIRPQHRPPSPPSSPAAFDNRAYQHDESDPNHNDSFTSNGPQQNGHTKEPNGDTKTLEAVNLELINLTPKNGNAKKKDVEVDMNASNPYDEYFVPVNEHRKYMRGEKLVVTADKRGEKSGCKRPLCWTLLSLVVAAVVAVIVLAATGILFTNSPTTLEQYNTSISSARALGGIGHDHVHVHDHDHDHEDHTMPAPEHGPDTQNDEGHELAMGSDESDSSLYVPRTVEGELKIDNEEFTPMLRDPDSNEYKEFVSTFTEGVKRALFDQNMLDYGDNDISVEVVQLREGSVIVTYRVHWKPKTNVQPSEDLLTPKTMEMKLENYLERYDRMISKYHVAEDKMVARPVLDICQINQNDCEHGCEFNERTLEFTCTCPPGFMLDMSNPKKCMSILENPGNPIHEMNNEPEKELPSPTPEPNSNTVESATHEEKPTADTEHVHEHQNTFDWKETHHMMPDTTTESDADVNFSHIFGSKHHETETEATHEAEPKPEPEPEPTSEPQPEEGPNPSAEPQPAAEPEPTAEPKPIEKPEPVPEPEPAPEPKPTAEPEPTAEPHPSVEPQPTHGVNHVMHELLPTPEPQPVEESHSEEAYTTNEPQPASEPNSNSQEEMEKQPNTTTEPKPEPEPTAEPHVETVNQEEHEHQVHVFQPEAMPTAEPQPNAEPESRTETELDTEHHSEITTTTKPHIVEVHEIPELVKTTKHDDEENTGESTGRAFDQENNVTSEEHTINMDDNVESKSTTAGSMETTTRISISEPNIINEPSYEPKPEIISILNSNKERTGDSVMITSSNNNESTTDTNEWLENNTQKNMNDETANTEREKSESNFQAEIDAIMKNLTSHNEDESESRSFKNIDSEVIAETTTMRSSSKSEEEVSFDLITKENEVPVTESIGKVEEETTKPIFSLHSDNDINDSEKEEDSNENTPEVKTTVASYVQYNEQTTTATNLKEEKTEDSSTQKVGEESNQESNVTSLIEEEKSLDSTTTMKPIQTTTLQSEIVTEYSIVQHHHGSDEDKKLIDALENKKNVDTNETSSESNDVPDEGSDVTFDAINMLYNRSSKSIETVNQTSHEISETNINITDVGSTTTETDWLSESVTEMNYDEAMNKMEKHETTEMSITKMDDIMNRELTKDDFEPDYLNNMGPNNKASEQEEPTYGMVHDYDNEDSRVKRVHSELTTEAVANEISNNAPQKMITEGSPAAKVPIETTTVSEYIYKSAERSTKQPEEDTIKQNSDESIMSVMSHEPIVTAAPAPVWEESEGEKDLSVKELMNKANNDITTARNVMIDDIIVPTTMAATTTKAPEPTTITSAPTTAQAAVMPTDNKMKDVSENGMILDNQNSTQVKNLNVNIYEISNTNGNASLPSPNSTNSNSAEYDDHETEMNPFLPEVENNKSLVKKLQEGHNIEPTNLNEMQNENVEDHSVAPEGHASSDDGLAVISKGNEESLPTTTVSSSTTESDTSFNELLMHVNSQDNQTEPPRTNAPELANKSPEVAIIEEDRTAKSHEKEILPVSTFLMDTDDLDTYKPTVTKIIPDGENTVTPVVPASINSDSEYLSVVPIEEERKEEDEALKGDFQKDNIQELNDISDSSNKSDRRTLDETKFDSVITNEA